MKKILVISAPSGGGKTIAVQHILQNFPQFSISVSSTTRSKRECESDGIHYYFINKPSFEAKIKNNEFIEYEYIFENYYGTLKSEIQRIYSLKQFPIFDVDVKGAFSIKKQYQNEALLVFLKPPSIAVLRERLSNRTTESEEQINIRIQRAEFEIEASKDFDCILTNDKLANTLDNIDKIIKDNFAL